MIDTLHIVGIKIAVLTGEVNMDYTIYTPLGFVTWDDEKSCVAYTARIEDAATWSTREEVGILRRILDNACVLNGDKLLTLSELYK